MKVSSMAVASGLIVVAIAAFCVGRGSPARQAQLPTPETGGPVPMAPADDTPFAKTPSRGIAAATGTAARGTLPSPATPTTPTRRTAAERPPTRRPEPPRVEAQPYHNRELNVALEKPKSTNWVLTDNKKDFRVPHPNKVLEIRRDPRDGSGRFAVVELYVLQMPDGASEAREAQKIERLEGVTRRRGARFTLLGERPVEIGGLSMTRRVTLLAFKGQQRKIVSVRAVRGGKLYMLVGVTNREHFDDLLPEFEQVIQSLRIH